MAVFWLPFVILTFFAWPSADDFFISLVAADHSGWWELFISLYQKWGGRYSAWGAAIMGKPVVENLLLYRLTLLITQLLLPASLFRFWSALLAQDTRAKDVVLIAGVFMLLWWQVTPDMAEGFFWLSGVMVYVWPLILFFWIMAGWLRVGIRSPAKVVLLSLGLFFLVGFNEMAAVLGLLAGVAGVVILRKESSGKMIWLTPMVMVGAGIALLLLAPGNVQRLSLFPEGRDMATALRIGVVSLAKLNGLNLLNLPLHLVLLMILPGLKREMFHRMIQPLLHWHPVWIFLVGQVLLFALLMIPAWSMGINPPLRVYSFLTPLWLLGFVWFWVGVRQRIEE
jgi:hypothetical protein